jgi:hypothetical protein
MDMSLKDFRGRGDHIPIYGIAREYNNPAGPVTAGIMFVRCLRSPACKAAYTEKLREMLAVFEGLGLEARARKYYEQIKPLVYADRRKEVTNAGFEAGVATVLRTIRERAAKVRAELPPN